MATPSLEEKKEKNLSISSARKRAEGGEFSSWVEKEKRGISSSHEKKRE